GDQRRPTSIRNGPQQGDAAGTPASSSAARADFGKSSVRGNRPTKSAHAGRADPPHGNFELTSSDHIATNPTRSDSSITFLGDSNRTRRVDWLRPLVSARFTEASKRHERRELFCGIGQAKLFKP